MSTKNHDGSQPPPPKPGPKQSVIKPNTEVSPHLREVLSEVRCYVWRYEARLDTKKQKWKQDKPARSPKTKPHQTIWWREDCFERDKHLWGSFEESLLAHERNRGDLQGVGVLIEPYRSINVAGEDRIPVWIDFDDCRSIYSGEVEPRVMEEIRKLDTYTELSPSGKGLRCLGWGRRASGSRTFFKIDSQDVEVYGGGIGGRHLITVTGQPLEGYDMPVRDIQEWIDQRVPLRAVAPEDANLVPEPLDLSDEEILSTMLTARDGQLIERFMEGQEELWEGEGTRYESRSDADVGFFRKLAFYTRGQRDQMRRLALSSKMRREKWNRERYLDDAIERGIEYCRGIFYDPDYTSKYALMEGFFEVWMRLTDPKIRGAFGALLAHANAYGFYTREGFIVKAHGNDHAVPQEGVLVYASLRNLGLWMGEEDVGNISKTMKTLREVDLLPRISKGEGSKASLYLIPSSLIPSSLLPSSSDSDSQHRRGTQVGDREKTSKSIKESGASLLCCKDESIGKDESIYQKLMWVRNPNGKTEELNKKKGLTHNQKLLIQLVLMGGITDPEDLAKVLGKRKNNLMSRVVIPLLELELLEWGEGESLKIPERFEETLHEVFVRSGGKETLEKTRVRFQKESEKHQEDQARIAQEIREIGRKSPLNFMEVDFERLYELEKRRR